LERSSGRDNRVMATANDSIAVTPGAGATVATQLADGKELQVLIEAGPNGNIIGTTPTYDAFTVATAATANRVYMHIFNASGSGRIVKVGKLYIQPSGATVTGVSQTWRVSRTTTAGTPGTTNTWRARNSTDPAVPAQVTASHGHSVVPTASFTQFEITINPEETLPIWGTQGLFNILPTDGDRVSDITLREGEGLMLQNITGLSYSYSALAVCRIFA
jgi:hypothetical protein